jgi:hypothetical protein
MKATGKTITLVLLVLLIGVNIATAMPTSDVEIRTGDATLRLFEGSEEVLSEMQETSESDLQAMGSNPIDAKPTELLVDQPNLGSAVPYKIPEKVNKEKGTLSLGHDMLKAKVSEPGSQEEIRNVAPIVNAGPDRSAFVGETIFFLGSFVDPQLGDSHDILWNFGDGNQEFGILNPTHVDHKPVVYVVFLRIVDEEDASGFDKLEVVVRDVRSVEDKISDLIEMVQEMNIPKQMEKNLIEELENALNSYQQADLKDALTQVSKFVLDVGVLQNKNISEQEATALIESAHNIRDQILNKMD